MWSLLRFSSLRTGANTHAKVLDYQAGYEKALTLLFLALAGINMIFYPGTIERAETISMESLILDHEICSTAMRTLKGIETGEDIYALDIIAKIGSGGNYLKERHTIDFLEAHLVLAWLSMKYVSETTSVRQALQEANGCVICHMHKKTEQHLIRYFLGNSVMQPHILIKVNQTGFCTHHFAALLEDGNRLGLALMTHTHVQELHKQLENHLAVRHRQTRKQGNRENPHPGFPIHRGGSP